MELSEAAERVCSVELTLLQDCESLCESFRALRDCSSREELRLQVAQEKEDVVSRTGVLLNEWSGIEEKTQMEVLLMNRAIQFLGNLSVGPPLASSLVWKSVPLNLWGKICAAEEKKTRETIFMPLYHCLSVGASDLLAHSNDFSSVIKEMLRQLESNDWALLCCEKLLCLSGFFSSFSEEIFCATSGGQILKCVCHLDSQPGFLASGNLDHSVALFLSEAVAIPWEIPSEDLDSVRISVFREVLQFLSGIMGEIKLDFPQKRSKDLFRGASELLKKFLRLGKSGNPLFKASKKLTEVDIPANSIGLCFGMKRDLIALIGNMSYRNPEIQALAAELEVLQVVLDCTCVETENPFIVQWSILAARNLCEGCLENQKVLAGLNLKGIVDNTGLLNQLGLEASIDEKGEVSLKQKNL